MGKISKNISLLIIIILGGVLLYNIFSKSTKESFNSQIYNKLKPINLTPKNESVPLIDDNDIAIKIARLWKIPEMNNKGAESCLKTFADQHPNNLVLNQNLTSLYGIEIGTKYWYELTDAFEKYAMEVCYSCSGGEIEKIFVKKGAFPFSRSYCWHWIVRGCHLFQAVPAPCFIVRSQHNHFFCILPIPKSAWAFKA